MNQSYSRNLTCEDLNPGEYGEIIGNEWTDSSSKDEASQNTGVIIHCLDADHGCRVFKSVSTSNWAQGYPFSNNGYYIKKISLEEINSREKKEEKEMDSLDNSDKTDSKIVAFNFKNKEDYDKFTKDMNFHSNCGNNYARGLRCEIKFLGYASGNYSFEDDFGNLKHDNGIIINLEESSFTVTKAPPEKVIVKVGEYNAIVSEDGETIKVGCQKVPFSEVEAAYQAMIKVRING